MAIPNSMILTINIVTLSIFAALVLIGYLRGLIKQLFDLVAIILGLLLAYLFAASLASAYPLLPSNWSIFQVPFIGIFVFKQANMAVWTIIICILTLILVLIARHFVLKVVKSPLSKRVNHILGAVYAIIPAMALIFLISTIIVIPVFSNGVDIANQTVLKPLVPISNSLINQVYTAVDPDGVFDKLMNNEELTVEDKDSVKTLLVTMGVPEDVSVIAVNAFTGTAPTEADVEVIKTWIEDNNITEDDIRTMLEQLGLSEEEINQILEENKP